MPLIVPEVNADAVAGYTKKNIIANPNCSTAQLVVVLKPLHDAAKIKRVVVSTYQSVSGAGKEAMDELWTQTKSKYVPGGEIEPQKFPKQIAFNCIPQIDVFMEDGYTKEEWKMMVETKKILDPKIKLTATCVRVPVFVGHSEAVTIEFENPISPEEARDILREAPGVMVVDKREPGGYMTPVEAAGEFATYVSRIREDATVENGLSLWIVSDNLLKGAALNTVQIAETIINRKLHAERRLRGGVTGRYGRDSGWLFGLGGVFGRLQLAERVDDQVEILQEALALLAGKHAEDPLVDLLGQRIGGLQDFPALVGQLHRIGARILFGAAALQQPLFQHAPDDVRQRRAIDAGLLDEMRLADALVLRNGDQNRVLARRQIPFSHLALEDVAGALTGPMQQVNWRSLQSSAGHFACLVTCHDCVGRKAACFETSVTTLRPPTPTFAFVE